MPLHRQPHAAFIPPRRPAWPRVANSTHDPRAILSDLRAHGISRRSISVRPPWRCTVGELAGEGRRRMQRRRPQVDRREGPACERVDGQSTW